MYPINVTVRPIHMIRILELIQELTANEGHSLGEFTTDCADWGPTNISFQATVAHEQAYTVVKCTVVDDDQVTRIFLYDTETSMLSEVSS